LVVEKLNADSLGNEARVTIVPQVETSTDPIWEGIHDVLRAESHIKDRATSDKSKIKSGGKGKADRKPK
jgi:hypothetical protein